MRLLAVFITSLTLARGLPKPRLDGRIVGGSTVDISQVPYQVALLDYGYHHCGGSIISPKHVVTAAHCTNGFDSKHLSIRYGSNNSEEGGVVVYVERVYQNPKFDEWELGNDVSVLALKNDIIFGENAQPIALATEEPIENTPLFVSDWGDLGEGGPSTSVLLGVKILAISRQFCNGVYNPEYKISKDMICAGIANVGGKDACHGDSGGPLVAEENSTKKLVGIVSWGLGCGLPDFPGVYSNVAFMRKFIEPIINM